ncbi:ATP synthase F1 subunit gamma [Candidatus Saccharibacteria bacterium]|nr:ATP synthase F1 subunit gamma [Candidatus Saccharibacteria bacterium]
MASTQVLKSRIRSVKNTKQITKAMQLVAASKMRRAQEATKASAPYTLAARELLTALSEHTSVARHPFFLKRNVKTRLLIVIASDKGLAGAYNSNVVKAYIEQLSIDKAAKINNSTIAIGRKAAQFVARIKDTQVLGVYEDLPDRPDGRELRAILDSARLKFTSGEVDAVDVIYTHFISSINQHARVLRVLPAGFKPANEPGVASDATYEPSTEEVLDGIAYRLVGAQIFQALLDARASEHSMRMLAMKNATDNASDLADDLTLEMNKARQGAITQELAEISGGVEALNE